MSKLTRLIQCLLIPQRKLIEESKVTQRRSETLKASKDAALEAQTAVETLLQSMDGHDKRKLSQ